MVVAAAAFHHDLKAIASDDGLLLVTRDLHG